MNFLLLNTLIFFAITQLVAEEMYPVYITGGVPISEYTLFANSGWDGNWYVGSNTCWIKKFYRQDIPFNKEDFVKSYIGVKLGRAKTQPRHNAPPWEKEVIDGNIYIGISSTPAWKSSQRYFLCSIKDIPTEGDWENAITTTAEARWFYTEVPLESIFTDSDLWVCLYSNTPYLNSASSSPIVAGGWRERAQQDITVWLNNEINCAPPINPENSLKTPIRAFDPAIVIKLIPAGSDKIKIELKIASITEGRKNTDEKVFYITSLTPNIERVWMEISKDATSWKRISKFVYTQPYVFSLDIPQVPQDIQGDFYIRFAANDIFENTGYTSTVQLNITRTTSPQPNSSQTSPKKKRSTIK